MDNLQATPTIQPTNSSEVMQLSQSLIYAFQLDEHCQQILKKQQHSETVEDAVRQWVLSTLVIPDKNLGTIIMPSLAQRFHDYIESIRRSR